MKTFKWTVPEPSRTDRERNPRLKERKSRPGLGWLIAGILSLLISLVYFSIANGFFRGVRTYFWSSGPGTIVSSDLRSYSTSGGGTVTYSVAIDGVNVEDTAEVFKRWTGDNRAKYYEWSSQYAPGRSATVYFNRSRDTSLGRWPTSYSYHFGIQGMVTLLMGLSLIYRGTEQLRASKAPQATPRREPVH